LVRDHVSQSAFAAAGDLAAAAYRGFDQRSSLELPGPPPTFQDQHNPGTVREISVMQVPEGGVGIWPGTPQARRARGRRQPQPRLWRLHQHLLVRQRRLQRAE
jgi:hypothetical protein